MAKSKRIYILNEQEINALYALPNFSANDREIFFSLNESEYKILDEIVALSTKIHFILQLGYFKAKQRLFQYDYSAVVPDVKFIIQKYFSNIQLSKYFLSNADKAGKNKRILTLFSFKVFGIDIKKQVIEYLILLARRLICHVTIFSELVSYLNVRNIILPPYTEDNWDDIQRILASLVIGNTTQSVIVSKLSSSKRNNRIKRALSEYNEIMQSLHLLNFIDDNFCRSSIRNALNRVESYHKLRRAITKVGGGKFIGRSPMENEIWNQCTRLIANCIIYYNALLLDQTMNALKQLNINGDYLIYINRISPVAWININLTGKYEFTGVRGGIDIEEFVGQLKSNFNDKILTTIICVKFLDSLEKN